MSTKAFFSRGWRIFSQWERRVFLKRQECWASFSRWAFRRFFSWGRELKNVQLWIKRCAHHYHFLVSQPIRVEEGQGYRLYYGRTTMEKLILLVSTLIMLWKIMLGETFILRRICHVSNRSNHSISMKKKHCAQSWAFSAEHLAFSAG